MKASKAGSDVDPNQVLVECWSVNQRMNQMVLENLNEDAWRARAPGTRTRTIAAIVSHMHNVRRKWLRLSIPDLKACTPLDRARATPQLMRSALEESAILCSQMLERALSQPKSDAQEQAMGTAFLRDGWAKPWPGGAAMVTYMISHEAHHRGQICLLAHQLGFPLPESANYGIWSWEKLWKDCGFTHPR